MGEAQQAIAPTELYGFRDWFADHLGVDKRRKRVLYEDLSNAATLLDATYWLQILFASGIATLGLVLNSPAVIIGAMLISPLMGPILSGGLALATGDVILGIRSIVNLVLSCLVAVTFAVLLVGLLPFKEMTGEIASRTQPNTLDLVVALFSGAIGSIATCKQVKGVVTSIPGVAIAVALMPPLGVVGYGIGYAVGVSGSEGMRIAGGGGLLFLTNLVAITFTAMVVFLALHIDTAEVKEQIEAWRAEDPESAWFRALLKRFHVTGPIRQIGSLPGRLLLIVLPIVVILIPLAQSFNQLKSEIARQQEENRIRRAATALWQQNFAKLPSGEQRSFIDQLSVGKQDGKLSLQLRVFTSRPLSAGERAEYPRVVAAKLSLPPDAVTAQLIEIPTASGELLTRAREEKRVQAPPSIAELQANFSQGIERVLQGLRLPPPAQMIDYRTTVSSKEAIRIAIAYLSDRDIEQDAVSLIADDVRSRLSLPAAEVELNRIEESFGPITFSRNQAAVTAANASPLDRAGQILKQHPTLIIEIAAGADQREREGLADERASAIEEYLVSKWQVAQSRISVDSAAGHGQGTMLKPKIVDRGQ
jgi:uncharacterized hydrophobic protein (TIGR00271 family)